MKTTTLYECDICGRDFNKPKDAIACEARGLHVEYPIGLIYGNHTDPGGMYGTITFAIAGNYRQGHNLNCSLWACRDRLMYGDSLGDEKCGSDGFTNLGAWDAQISSNAPHFKRMVAWLESQSIPVTVWDGKKPVPIDQWGAANSTDPELMKGGVARTQYEARDAILAQCEAGNFERPGDDPC